MVAMEKALLMIDTWSEIGIMQTDTERRIGTLIAQIATGMPLVTITMKGTTCVKVNADGLIGVIGTIAGRSLAVTGDEIGEMSPESENGITVSARGLSARKEKIEKEKTEKEERGLINLIRRTATIAIAMQSTRTVANGEATKVVMPEKPSCRRGVLQMSGS